LSWLQARPEKTNATLASPFVDLIAVARWANAGLMLGITALRRRDAAPTSALFLTL